MRLYGYWRSSSTWRVRIALALKGVEYETVPVHLVEDGGHQHRPDYRALNPMRQVPYLACEDGRGLAQSMAIIEYLEARWPEPPLLPRHPYDRARACQLAEIVNAGIQPLQNLATIRQIDALGESGRDWAASWIARGFAALEAEGSRTAGRYLYGDEVTVADLFLVPQLYNARRFGVALERYPTLLRVEAACLDLEAFKASHPDRQPDAPRPEAKAPQARGSEAAKPRTEQPADPTD